MSEREFNKAANRAAYEDLNLKEEDRKRIEDISRLQRLENKRLRQEQRARWDRDMAIARQVVVTQHNSMHFKPGWHKGRPLSKGKVEHLAYRSVRAANQRELDLSDARFEREKSDIIDSAYLPDREAIKKDREQKKYDRKVTQYRSRYRDKGDRGR